MSSADCDRCGDRAAHDRLRWHGDLLCKPCWAEALAGAPAPFIVVGGVLVPAELWNVITTPKDQP